MKPLQTIANKDVTRKEFLTISAFGVASILGIGTIIELLTGKSPKHHLKQYTDGYSSGDYGGKKKVKLA
jgi:hypothetical protein